MVATYLPLDLRVSERVPSGEALFTVAPPVQNTTGSVINIVFFLKIKRPKRQVSGLGGLAKKGLDPPHLHLTLSSHINQRYNYFEEKS